MSAGAMDLAAYLRRIGWDGGTAPTYETMAGVLAAHMAAIPFENLDVLLGRPVRVDLEGVEAKLVGARRGGYCFEHATLLEAALRAMGFAPVAHTARVTMVVPREQAPRTHMFLTVELPEGRFVLDPGFGALAPRVPVPVGGEVVRFGAEQHALVKDGAAWVLRIERGDGSKAVDGWVATLERDYPVDFEMGNHYTSTHPRSGFKQRLMLRALLPDGRVSVMNRDVTVARGGRTETRKLADRGELRALL
ncbi:MAG TPA: arylamine N-acetyltransferase, partial [Polyangiaceae bacterium]